MAIHTYLSTTESKKQTKQTRRTETQMDMESIMILLLDDTLKIDWRARTEVVKSVRGYLVLQKREACNVHWDNRNKGYEIYLTGFSELLDVVWGKKIRIKNGSKVICFG